MKLYLRTIKRYQLTIPMIIIVITSSIMEVACLIETKIFQMAVNSIGTDSIKKMVISLILVEIFIPSFSWVFRNYKAKTKETFSQRYSTDLYEKCQNLSMKELEDLSIPTVTSAVKYNFENSDYFVTMPGTVVNCFVSFIVAFILMATEDLRLAIIITCMNFVIGFIINYVLSGFQKLIEEIRKADARINACITRLEGYLVTKSFGRENYEKENFQEAATTYRDAVVRKIRRNYQGSTFVSILYGIEDVVIILYIVATYDGNLAASISKALLFYSLSYYLFQPFEALPDYIDHISSLMVHLKQNEEILGKEDEYDGEVDLLDFQNSIEFKNVSFAYNDTATTLSNVNVRIEKGEKVGIYGKSGCGKSTFVNLLNRFFLPQEGEILIDGVNINQFTKKSLRRIIGNVNQDITLFSDMTIRENIKYGTNCTDVEMVKAAKLANCHGFIKALPDGYESKVGNNGVKLSGGEKQRIAIARLFLLNPKILILDEATSKLDSESEQLIKESIEKLSKDKTVISIAHRFNTIENSDLFIGIQDHTIKESGTRQDICVPGSLWNKLRKV